jgi:hypothetical protein
LLVQDVNEIVLKVGGYKQEVNIAITKENHREHAGKSCDSEKQE